MKVLIFYSRTGSGHLRAAEALKKEIESQRKEIEVVLSEGLENARFGIKTNPSFAYSLFSSKLQRFYNLIYTLTNNKHGVKLLRLFIKGVWGENIRKIIEKQKPDLIISTHHHISPSTIQGSIKIPFITVVTDLGNPHIIWYDQQSSKIITPTKEIAEIAKETTGKPSQIISIGYPLKNNFISNGKAQTDNILIVGGGIGSGNIYSQVDSILKALPDKKLTVICGMNNKLQGQLKEVATLNQNLQVLGFVDNMPNYYNKADLLITKAGPGTIVESAILKKPLIITSWVGMQEKDNVDFVIKNNLGIYEPDVKKLPEAVNKIYSSYDKYIHGTELVSGGTKKIVEFILKEYI